MKHFCVDIPASKTATLLEINRNTINRYYGLFREALFWHQNILGEQYVMHEDVEADESYFGARRVRGRHGKRKRGRGTNKQPVFGLLERDGKVYTQMVPNCKKKTLQRIIKGHVAKDSIIYTDGWRGYSGVVDYGYKKHYRVKHGENEFSKGDGIHINGIENFWSFTKRRLAKFNGVGDLNIHLKECEWRYNTDDSQLLTDLGIIYKKYIKML